MANNNSVPTAATTEQELGEMRKRLDWLDDERRKVTRKLAEMEQRAELQDREISSREQRIQDLEKQLSTLNMQIARLPQTDAQLDQFKDDLTKMIDLYDRRRIEADKELDRLRRVEHESMTREIADIRKQLPAITRIEQDLELRQAEDARLANLIGVYQNAQSQFRTQVEAIERAIAFLEEKEKQTNKNLAEVQAALPDLRKNYETFQGKMDVLNLNYQKVQTAVQQTNEAQTALRDSIKDWSEQVQIGEHERNQRLAAWQRAMDEHSVSLARFTQEWVKFNNQFNESRTAVEDLKSLREQLAQQQQESSEMVRVETSRLESRWDAFSREDSRKWKNFETDFLQRQSVNDRRDKQTQEQLQAVHELLEVLEQDRDTLRRIQTAQADAIKKWPLLWLEEVEKAIDQDPNRRRQPTTSTQQEE